MESLRIIFPAHISTRRKPVNMLAADLPIFEKALNVPINETSLQQLENVSILKNYIFSPRHLKFYTSEAHILPVPGKKMLKSLLYFLKPFNQIEKGIWITDEWSSEYFHWLTDALPRVISSVEYLNGHLVVLPDAFQTKRYITESLALLGLKPYFYNKRKRLFIKNLMLPSHTAPTGNYNKDILQKLRSHFSMPGETKPGRRIYISRRKADKRNILNEEAVINLLIQYGFETHFFEDYSFEKQIGIMCETHVLIGLHGAGLTNMLFMPRGGNN